MKPKRLLSALALFLGLAWAAPQAWPQAPQSLAVSAPNPETARLVRRIVQEAAPKLTALTGGAPEKIKIIVARDREDFQQRASRLGGPDWAAGLAMPKAGLILVRSAGQLTNPSDFKYLLIHELTHIYLGSVPGAAKIPHWLEEGLAMHASSEQSWSMAQSMARGVLMGKLIPLSRISRGFPAGQGKARLAYAQSYYFVGYLMGEYGPGVLPRLISILKQDRDLTYALHRLTGKGLKAMERDFTEAMKTRFSWLALAAGGGTLWAVLSVIAGVMLVWRRKVQLRQRKAAYKVLQPVRDMKGARKWPPPPPRADVLRGAGLERSQARCVGGK